MNLNQNIDQPLSAILSLNTIAHTIGAAGVGAEAIKLFGDASLGVVSAILTILILIITEIIPKTFGARYWKNLAKFTYHVINIMLFYHISSSNTLTKITKLIAKIKTQILQAVKKLQH